MNVFKKIWRRIQYATKRKMYPDVIRHKWLVQKCYEDMYAFAGVDFNALVDNATLNDRGEKEIPFNDCVITEAQYFSVLDFYRSFLKEEYYKESLSNKINLGCSPRYE